MTVYLTLFSTAATQSQKYMIFPGNTHLDTQIHISNIENITVSLRKIKNIFISPSASSLETAKKLNLKGELDTRLAECNYGDWAGLSLKDIAKSQPYAFKEWLNNPYFTVPGGESIKDIFIRTQNWLTSLDFLSGHYLVLTHAPIIRCALILSQSFLLERYYKINIAPLTFVKIILP